MENHRDRLPKFEEMSGFREIKSDSLQSNLKGKIINKFVYAAEMILELLDYYVVPFFVMITIIWVLIDLAFYSSNMVYNFFRLVTLSILLYYRYKRSRF